MAAIQYSLDILARKGRFVLLSQPQTVPIPSQDLIFKDITVVGSLQGNRRTLREVLEICAKESIRVETRSWRLDDINEMLKCQKSPDLLGKNVVVFD